jgi:peptidoglycan/LPS O-acetylase OafA/YrhL
MNVAFGVLVADLQVEYGDALTEIPGVFPILLMIIGMFCAGYPQDAPETYHWSDIMRRIMFTITPTGGDLRRYWDSIAASLLLLGVLFSAPARRVLTSSWLNFCGRVSFPVYLLHNQLIKSLLTWLVYFPSALAWSAQEEKEGEIIVLQKSSTVQVFAACAIFFYVLYRIAWLWTLYVDPLCMRVVKWVTAAAHGERGSVNLVQRKKLLG